MKAKVAVATVQGSKPQSCRKRARIEQEVQRVGFEPTNPYRIGS
jgi:hypothetical protein